MKEQLMQLLKRVVPGVDFTVSDTLVDDGILDSLTITTIIAEISMEFDMIIPFEELVSENFNSVDNMVELVKKVKGL